MADVRLIAAVGKSGQIGHLGRLPWNDPADLAWFKRHTMNGIVVVGPNTAQSLPNLPGRTVLVHGREHPPAGEFLELIAKLAPDKIIWIAGGAKTYAKFMPFVRHLIITRIDYDGEADVFMPALWQNGTQND